MYRHIISNSSSHVGLKYECTNFMLLQRNRFLIVITKVWGISLYTPNRLLLRKGYETRRSTWLFSIFVFVWNEKQELFFIILFPIYTASILHICNKFQTRKEETHFFTFTTTPCEKRIQLERTQRFKWFSSEMLRMFLLVSIKISLLRPYFIIRQVNIKKFFFSFKYKMYS